MKYVVGFLKIVGALDGAVAVIAGSVAEMFPAHASGCHAVLVACGSVGSVLAVVAKFAAPAPVPPAAS